MTYYLPDLTGQNPLYREPGEIFTISRGEITLDLAVTAFVESIVVTPANDPTHPLVEGVEWLINDSDIDWSMMAKLTAADPSFSARLAKSVTLKIASAILQPVKVSIAYQRIYPLALAVSVSGNQLVRLSPELILETLSRIAALEVQRKSSTLAITKATPTLLTEDPHGTNQNNVLEGVSYTINTLEGRNIIRPVNGAFFADSVVLTTADGQPLSVKAIDCAIAKTTNSANKSGVYETLLVNDVYVGEVFLTAHYFGGQVSVEDVSAVYDYVKAIESHLENNEYMTEGALTHTPVIQYLQSRIQTLETSMRQLASGATYDDVTSGRPAVLYRLQATDSNRHWWTIAKLFKVDGSDTIITADRMRLRCALVNAKIDMDVTVQVNLESSEIMTLTTQSLLQDPGYTKYVSVSPLLPTVPQFRIIYVEDVGVYSGIYLQIGLNLPGLVDTLSIEDQSGIESCWILLPPTATPFLPADTNVWMPDGSSLWARGAVGSKQEVHQVAHRGGYLVYSGALPLLNMTSLQTFTSSLPTDSVLGDIDVLEFDIDNNSSPPLRVRMPMTLDADGTTLIGQTAIPIITNVTVGDMPVASSLGVLAATLTATTLKLALTSTSVGGSSQALRYVTAIGRL